tara:strand:+ start:110 stop:517 length:408 start_codon:yes stop_codon:yes gene_type:complete
MSADTLLSHHFTACGLNADWGVSAWHVGGNEPNRVSGDTYVVEDEDTFPLPARFFVVQRFYIDGDNDEIKELAGPLTAEDAILTCEHYAMSGKRPCDKCGVIVPKDEYCGNDRPDGTSEYLCPDCYTPDTTKRTS